MKNYVFTIHLTERTYKGELMIYFAIAAAIFIGELLLKNHIEKHKIMEDEKKILGGKIITTRYHNYGAFLNFMEKNKKLLLFVSGILMGMLGTFMLIIVPQKGKKLLKVGLSFLLGGAASNVYDRFTRGYVVDYFSFSFLKKVIFNISDFFVFVGGLLTAIWMAFHE